MAQGVKTGKRERLVASAAELLYRKGVPGTTLADVANAAAVPVGNVFYYFKTKDELIRAVIDARVEEATALFAQIEAAHPDPATRLKALIGGWEAMRDEVARYGCPLGGLAHELDRRDDGLDREASRPIGLLIDWAERRFAELGAAQPRELAVTLFAGVQGAAALASAFRDPELLSAQLRRLERWIDDTA